MKFDTARQRSTLLLLTRSVREATRRLIGRIRTRLDWSRALFIAGLVISIAVIYGPALVEHIRRASNPYVFNDDVRIHIFPFFKYEDPALFPTDYFGPYIRACFVPIGYRVFYTVNAFLWGAAATSKVLPYILLIVTLLALAIAAHRLAGYSGAFSAMALTLSNPIFLARLAGGLQRSFAFPMLALSAVALIYAKPRLLAAITCIGAAFYPSTAIVAGIALTMWLLVFPPQSRSGAHEWTLFRRLRLLAITGGVSFLILLPTVFATHAYGRALGPKDALTYPELGRDGRYGSADRPPFGSFPQRALEQAQALFVPVGQPYSAALQRWAKKRDRWTGNAPGDVIIEIVTAAMIVGGVLFAAQDKAARRFLLIAAAAWVAHVAAKLVMPYLFIPQRYVAYPIPIMMALIVPAAGAALARQISQPRLRPIAQEIGAIIISLLVLLPFGGRGSAVAGLDIDVTAQHRLYDFVARLPKDVLIAGWPTQMDDVPYVCRRQAFLTSELHLPQQKGYTDEMRRRARALINAYFATDLRPLQYLRDHFGVTHLIFDEHALESPPWYFKPFSNWVQEAFTEGQPKGFEIPRQLNSATVFSDGSFYVLDLHRLSKSP
jgi:hypothetical protein